MSLRARGLVRTWRGRDGADVRAVDGVDLDVGAGACCAIAGPSGCGKSTLLALLGALDRPGAGVLEHDGVDLSAASGAARARLRRRIGFVFQGAPMLRGLPVWENVTQGLVPRGFPPDERRATAIEAIGRLGLRAVLADRDPRELSAGERRRVALARALATRPRLVVADEPTAELDAASARLVRDGLAAALADGVTVVLASHDDELLGLAPHVVRMADGRFTAA
jgi:ABC-type lipoprotein export system ATPase subunit